MSEDEPRRGIDKDRLAMDAEEGELPPRAGEQPDLIAVTEIRGGVARRAKLLARRHGGGLDQPLPRDDLTPVPGAVICEHEAKPRPIPQCRAEAEKPGLAVGRIDHPAGVRFGTHRLP